MVKEAGNDSKDGAKKITPSPASRYVSLFLEEPVDLANKSDKERAELLQDIKNSNPIFIDYYQREFAHIDPALFFSLKDEEKAKLQTKLQFILTALTTQQLIDKMYDHDNLKEEDWKIHAEELARKIHYCREYQRILKNLQDSGQDPAESPCNYLGLHEPHLRSEDFYLT